MKILMAILLCIFLCSSVANAEFSVKKAEIEKNVKDIQAEIVKLEEMLQRNAGAYQMLITLENEKKEIAEEQKEETLTS